MRHFHVIRWSPVGVSTGERFLVPDLDYASVSTSSEAQLVVAGAWNRGERSSAYECGDHCCTLHGPRSAAATTTAAAAAGSAIAPIGLGLPNTDLVARV